MDRYNGDKENNKNADAMIRAFENTSVCIFMYYPQEKKIIIPEKTCKAYNCEAIYTNMPYSFAENVVHKDDYEVFNEMYFKIDEGKKTVTSKFHSKDLNFCWRVTLTTLNYDDFGKPVETFGIIEDVSEAFKNECLIEQIQKQLISEENNESEVQEAVNLIASSIGGMFYAIYHIWIESKAYICFQEKMQDVALTIEKNGNYEDVWDKYIEKYVDEEDRKAMYQFTEFSTLTERLRHTDMIMHSYRRKGIGWTRGQFIVAKRDSTGNVTNVIFVVSDINDEVEREMKQQKAVYEAQHDALTDVYNRNGFDKNIEKYKTEKHSIGFALIDIDNFKSLNDTYGHDVGDKVLKQAARCLLETMHRDDSVFRFGGDEFGVLLMDFEADTWNVLCRKQEYIHRTLNELFPNQKNITLSIGVSFSNKGYSEELFLRADEALYETKKNGRAGCTLIDENHTIIKKWRDEKISLHTEVALNRSTTGVYRMEFPANADEMPRMICNETAKMILGVDMNATPEQCYQAWVKGIESSYIEALWVTRRKMVKEHQAECTYLWNHPEWGQIYVRSGGFGETINGMEVLYGYHHALKDTEIVERRDDNKKIVDVLNDIYFISYYVNIKNDTYSTIREVDYAKKMLSGCSDIKEVFSKFITTLVKPEYSDRMQSFCDVDTLEERLKENKHIDCEYKSQVYKGWCQASFMPVDYDEAGELSHVLFVISKLDDNKAKEIEEGIYSKKSLSALFDNVPGGIVMYEWNGERFKILHISDYYAKQYGASLVSEKSSESEPDLTGIHPDDFNGYRNAVKKALYDTHYLEYVYRVWNEGEGRYVWVKINAVFEPQTDGTSLIYAMYSDITEQKEAEQRLEKNRVSFLAALNASNQLCYEYDPIEHTGECYTDENFFDLPKKIENYPDCLRDYELIHPEDREMFVKTAHLMDGGEKTSSCDIRMKKNGEYCWYSCNFNLYFDSNKQRNVAILTVIDISVRVAAVQAFEERLQSIVGMNEKSLTIGKFNLTKNTYRSIRAEEEMTPYIDETKPFEELMMNAAESVVGSEVREKYRKLFSRDNLLKMASEGKMYVKMEHLFRVSENHIEWLESVLDMVKNPITGEIGGVCHSKSVQEMKMATLLLKKTLQQDYPMSAVIMVDTDEFYMYDSENGTYEECKYKFWDKLSDALRPVILSLTLEQIANQFSKEKIIDYLEKHREYVYSFDSEYKGEKRRLEIKFSYLDDTRNLLLASLRNITDSVLLEKLKYDSEHDQLTKLYNRRTVFKKCRKLLDEHPDEQFVMAHIDMKHFHLYNTFFGDEIGDKLLCDIADMFRNIDIDYEYWAYGRIEADVFCALFPFEQEKYSKHLQDIILNLEKYREDFLIEPKLGLYFIDDRYMSIESMFTRATIASKAVKAGVVNATVIYNENMEKRLIEEKMVVNDMQIAIEQEQFEVYLQPKYSLRTNKPVGAEALVRWNHPKRGIISPAKFIPVFEGNGFIVNLDHYMWEHVCILLRKWMDEGIEIMPISVNVSRISMFSQTTVQFLKELVSKYNISPEYLELELTETAYIDDPDEMKSQMNELRNAGFKILMDDFGSGYSSLNTLKDLPVDCLKLDMKFLSHSSEDIKASMVLSSIIRMSKMLELFVIAEGVEKREQADFLRSIGCEFVQGYLYARPMPALEYEQILKSGDIETQYEKQESIDLIRHMLADTATSMIGDNVPVPIGLLEYTNNGKFAYLRVNPIFLTEFELTEDLHIASKVFRNHLSDENYKILIDAFAKCNEIREIVEFKIVWNANDGTKRKYLGRVSYQGDMGQTFAMIVTTFVNITE